ncbi:MAG: DUF2147 domain-containing protein [Bacteroidia bacterium]|nr:DUF2147 domain-containing protein [Bacteroidia bacterium]
MKKLSVVFAFLLMVSLANAQNIVGKWKTIDDETGKPKSVVEIYQKGNEYFGRVIKLFREPSEPQDPVCDKCSDDRKGKKVLGMEVIRNLKKKGNEYADGTIMDPKKGQVYDCKIWLEGNTLKVRGYVLFLYRTQTWHPYKE